jgi:hypothetical protein
MANLVSKTSDLYPLLVGGSKSLLFLITEWNTGGYVTLFGGEEAHWILQVFYCYVCMASLVWNIEFLKSTAARIPGHPFGMIPLLSNAGLLAELKLLVTIKKEGNMTLATGIPPHISQAVLIKNTFKICKETCEAIKNMTEHVKDAVKQAFEEKAKECGQMMGERKKFQLHWKPIFSLMEGVPGLELLPAMDTKLLEPETCRN